MCESLTLRLPMPPSVNAAYLNAPGRGRVATAALRTWKAAASVNVQQAIAAVAERPVFHGCVEIVIRLPVPSRGEPDADNRIKPVQDMLVAAGVIADDSWRYVASSAARWVYDGSLGDECEVTVRQIAPEPATRARTAAKRPSAVRRQRPDVSAAQEADVVGETPSTSHAVEMAPNSLNAGRGAGVAPRDASAEVGKGTAVTSQRRASEAISTKTAETLAQDPCSLAQTKTAPELDELNFVEFQLGGVGKVGKSYLKAKTAGKSTISANTGVVRNAGLSKRQKPTPKAAVMRGLAAMGVSVDPSRVHVQGGRRP